MLLWECDGLTALWGANDQARIRVKKATASRRFFGSDYRKLKGAVKPSHSQSVANRALSVANRALPVAPSRKTGLSWLTDFRPAAH